MVKTKRNGRDKASPPFISLENVCLGDQVSDVQRLIRRRYIEINEQPSGTYNEKTFFCCITVNDQNSLIIS
jgi:hypothetical protein